MKRIRVLHLAVRVLAPGFQDGEVSGVELPQAVETRLHAGTHATRVAGGKCDVSVRVKNEFVPEAGRISLDVIENWSAHILFFTIWIAIPSSKRVWYLLPRVIEVRLSKCCWQHSESSGE